MPAWKPASVETTLGSVSYAEQGEGMPLLLLHSLLTDRRAFDRVVDDLPGRVIAVDLPGFGASNMTAPSIEDYAALINASVPAICGEDGLVTVMGNGLGAFVGLGMAVADGSRLERLILVGCGATFPEDAKPAFTGMIDAVRNGGMPAVAGTALRRIFTGEYLTQHPEEAEERSRVLAETNPEAFMRACHALQQVDFRERVGGVTTPTRIVVGLDDQATPPEMARDLHELMPDSTLVTLPEVAHAPQIQTPAAFVESIKDYLEA
jgi:3-oxoadipate enol-lactonase